jgi:hypothetical protein
MRTMTRRVFRGLCCLLTFVVFASATGAQPATPDATPVSTSAPLDLAAMALTPADLETLGFTGYLVADGRTQTLDDRVAEQAEDEDSRANVRSFLTGIGWIRGYRARLARPITDGEEDFDALISTGVTQFETASGAESALDLNSARELNADGATPVAGATSIGDRSVVLQLSDVTLDDGESREALRVLFQYQEFLGDAIAFSPPDEPLESGDIEAIATRLLERIEAVLADGGPGLSVQVLRWQGVGLADPDLDNYQLIAGEAYEALGDSAEERADDVVTYEDAIDKYVYEAALTDTLFQASTVIRFTSEAAAGDWVQGSYDRAVEDQEPGTELEERTDAPAFGDESVAVRFLVPAGEQELVAYGAIVRIGEVVIGVLVGSLATLDADTVWTMAEEQLECFEAGDCTHAAALPEGLGG